MSNRLSEVSESMVVDDNANSLGLEDLEKGTDSQGSLPPDFIPDFVLVRAANLELEENEELFKNVKTFEKNLKTPHEAICKEKGLNIQETTEKVQDDSERVFILISADDELLKSYAEALRIRLPIDRNGKN